MPIYPYICQACQKTMKVLAKVSGPPPAECKVCGQYGQLIKQISRTAFQLKGDGWYSSGYEGRSNCANDSASDTNISKIESSNSGS